MKLKFSTTLLSCILFLGACGESHISPPKPKVMLPSIAAPKPTPNEIVVALQPTKLERREKFHFTLDANGNPIFEDPQNEKLVRGDLKVGDEQTSFYLPLYGPHQLTTKENHSFDNTSTLINIDSDHDGKLQRSEDWYSSLPIRLGDKMFDVDGIDPGSKWVLLGKSASPLSGAIVGKKCPGFQFVTTDGRIAALADFKGKSVLLDVWSMT